MAVSPSLNNTLVAATAQPVPVADGTSANMRGNAYGEQVFQGMFPNLAMAVADGNMFYARNATIGTGVANAITTGFVATTPTFYLKNTSQVASIMPWELWMTQTATAPATGLTEDFVFVLDSGNRAPTANNVSPTINNLNPNSGKASICNLQAFNGGQLTVPAAVSATEIWRTHIVQGLNVVNDTYYLHFGDGNSAQKNGGAAVRATDPASFPATCPPIVIPPNYTLLIYRIGLAEATNTPSYEWGLSWVERAI